MQQTNDHIESVVSLISRARFFDEDIGYYQAHYVLDSSTYFIELDNGKLEMPVDMVVQAEQNPESVPQDAVLIMASGFVAKPIDEEDKQTTKNATEEYLLFLLALIVGFLLLRLYLRDIF